MHYLPPSRCYAVHNECALFCTRGYQWIHESRKSQVNESFHANSDPSQLSSWIPYMLCRATIFWPTSRDRSCLFGTTIAFDITLCRQTGPIFPPYTSALIFAAGFHPLNFEMYLHLTCILSLQLKHLQMMLMRLACTKFILYFPSSCHAKT